MPGVTIRKSGPQASRTRATSWGEATTPSAPGSRERTARRRTGSSSSQLLRDGQPGIAERAHHAIDVVEAVPAQVVGEAVPHTVVHAGIDEVGGADLHGPASRDEELEGVRGARDAADADDRD